MRNARNAFSVIAAAAALTGTVVFDAGVRLHAQRAPSDEQKKVSRIDRLEAWVAAANRHKPGDADEGVLAINQWTSEELRGVWIDVVTLTSLVREPSVVVFYPPGDPELRSTPSGWVTVTGPPSRICSRNVGITDPAEPITFPNLTATNRVV